MPLRRIRTSGNVPACTHGVAKGGRTAKLGGVDSPNIPPKPTVPPKPVPPPPVTGEPGQTNTAWSVESAERVESTAQGSDNPWLNPPNVVEDVRSRSTAHAQDADGVDEAGVKGVRSSRRGRGRAGSRKAKRERQRRTMQPVSVERMGWMVFALTMVIAAFAALFLAQ